MKRLLGQILFVLFFFTQLLSAQYHINDVVRPPDGKYYLKHDMSIINGKIISEFGVVGEVVNGVINGEHKLWYENGQIKLIDNLQVDGDRSDGFVLSEVSGGELKKWYENGRLESVVMNESGDFVVEKEWYENGQLKKLHKWGRKYPNRGFLLNGSKRWYENGQIEQIFMRDGVHQYFYDNGQIKAEVPKYQGEIKSKSAIKGVTEKVWYRNGNIKFIRTFDWLGSAVKWECWNEYNMEINCRDVDILFWWYYD